ncbi:MAG: transketolase [Chloroflexota bacterium]
MSEYEANSANASPSTGRQASVVNAYTEASKSAGKKSPARSYTLEEMQQMAKRLRCHIVTMICAAGCGHPGGSLSAVEILTALYFRVLRHDPADPKWPDRDRFVLSKGHGAPVLYATLAEAGYLPTEELTTLRRLDSRLQGHTDMRLTPGVEMSAGSLGQGLSYGVGIALAGRLDHRDYKVYVLLGDGECDEGQVWEAAMFASHRKLDNLVAIVDRNKQQLDGSTSEIMELEPFADKWRAFGWNVVEVDGHDLKQVVDALEGAKGASGQPTMIIAHTVKGKGVTFMECNLDFHGRAPTPDEMKQALQELA